MILHTFQGAFQPMRPNKYLANDVTADDTFLDGTTTFIGDFTRHDVMEIGPEFNAVEIIFDASATDNTESFSAKFWGGIPFAGGHSVGVRICDVTGAMSDVISPRSARFTGRVGDGTRRLCGDLTITAQYHSKAVTVISNNDSTLSPARLMFDTVGMRYLYVEFSNVGDTTEVNNIMAYARPY